jgi:hypothetical protein
MIRGAGLAFVFGLALTPDLDVGVPPGSPLDFVRIPVATPNTPRRDVPTPAGGPGATVVERPLDRVPRKPIPLSRPLTVDFESHLQWKPSEIRPNGTPTGAGPLVGYPPLEPRDLYLHCASFFLMLLLHEDQVSPREVLSYLVEIGEPAAYAATAVRVEEPLRALADYVIAAAGGLPPTAPRPSKVKADDDIARELVLAFPYEDRFGAEFLKLPGNVALPSLTKLAESKGHSFLARNAVYALRLYDEDQVLPTLRTLLKSQDKVIRNRALAALLRWQDREIVPWLIDQLSSTDLPFRSYALYALGRIGDRRAVDPVLKSAKALAGDWEFLWGALTTLARLRDSSDEVSAFLGRVPGILNRLTLPEARRQILAERVRITAGTLGNKTEQTWMRTAKVQEANRRLVEEWLESERPPMEPVKPPPAAVAPRNPVPAPDLAVPRPPPPTPAAPPSPSALALSTARERLLDYRGVRSVRGERDAIVIEAATEEDVVDLQILLGSEVNGVRVEFQILR